MIEVSTLESKIIKQVEYYFGDLNISRDKFMKQQISENDGWISFDVLLKFNRLRSLSDDTDFIKEALTKSTSGLLELGPKGVRRCTSQQVPDSFDEVSAAYKDRSVYVKGFDADASLDEIMDWLEQHGGKTLNIHMRRLPKDKKFKGSIFAVFERKEDADKFLNSNEGSVYKGNDMIRMYREDYFNMKKNEKVAKLEARAQKNAATEAERELKVTSRMTPGALLELSGLPEAKKGQTNTNGNPEDDQGDVASAEDSTELLEGPTVMALKQWLVEKLGTNYPLAWIDVDPAKGKAIVRFRTANTAESALAKLKSAFDEAPIVYANHELSARILSGDEEFECWKTIFTAQLQKAQKRRGGRQNSRGSCKRRRTK